MDWITIILKQYGLAGLVIFGLCIVIWRYLLPVIVEVGKTNKLQAESLVKVSENLLKINSNIEDIPDHIHAAKDEIINAVKSQNCKITKDES